MPTEPVEPVPPPQDPFRCSFCMRSQREVRWLIAGPMVYICEECVDLCAALVHDLRLDRARQTVIDRKAGQEGQEGKGT